MAWASSSFPDPAEVPRELSVGQGRGPVRSGEEYRVRDMPQPGDTCRNCGRKGQWARECRGAEGYGSAAANPQGMEVSVSIVTHGRNEVEVYLALRLKAEESMDYWMQDATRQLSVVESYRMTAQFDNTEIIRRKNGTEIAVVGEVELIRMLAEYQVTTAVVVPEEMDDLILEIDWLGRHRCRWSFAQNLIEIDGMVVRMINRPRRSMLRRIYAVEHTRSFRLATQSTYK